MRKVNPISIGLLITFAYAISGCSVSTPPVITSETPRAALATHTTPATPTPLLPPTPTYQPTPPSTLSDGGYGWLERYVGVKTTAPLWAIALLMP